MFAPRPNHDNNIRKKIFVLNPNHNKTNQTVAGLNGVHTKSVANGSRHLLPTIPMQSTFKSLLTIPISTVATNGTNGNAPNGKLNYSSSGLTSSAANTKVYFRPQDLANRVVNEKTETYVLQKNATAATAAAAIKGNAPSTNGLTKKLFVNISSSSPTLPTKPESPRVSQANQSPRYQPSTTPRVQSSLAVREKETIGNSQESLSGGAKSPNQMGSNYMTLTTTSVSTTKTTTMTNEHSSSVVNVRSHTPVMDNSTAQNGSPQSVTKYNNNRKLKSWASGNRIQTDTPNGADASQKFTDLKLKGTYPLLTHVICNIKRIVSVILTFKNKRILVYMLKFRSVSSANR